MLCRVPWSGCSIMDFSSILSDYTAAIRAEARKLGFAACGFAPVGDVPAGVMASWQGWIEGGKHACMSYMERYGEVRRNPAMLLDGANTVICVAMNYCPSDELPQGHPRFAYYAYGQDYHELMRERLGELAAFMERMTECRNRVCCDTAPLFERYWATRAGIGFIGRHTQLIVPGAGSYFFLGEILTTLSLPSTQPVAGSCGDCRRCIEACPTHAICDNGTLDTRRCLSCQTIENRGGLPVDVIPRLGMRVYGCDTCQQVCPYNEGALPTQEAALQPSDEMKELSYERLKNLSREEFASIFRHSAVKRVKYEGLMRNVNALNPALFEPRDKGTDEPSGNA